MHSQRFSLLLLMSGGGGGMWNELCPRDDTNTIHLNLNLLCCRRLFCSALNLGMPKIHSFTETAIYLTVALCLQLVVDEEEHRTHNNAGGVLCLISAGILSLIVPPFMCHKDNNLSLCVCVSVTFYHPPPTTTPTNQKTLEDAAGKDTLCFTGESPSFGWPWIVIRVVNSKIAPFIEDEQEEVLQEEPQRTLGPPTCIPPALAVAAAAAPVCSNIIRGMYPRICCCCSPSSSSASSCNPKWRGSGGSFQNV